MSRTPLSAAALLVCPLVAWLLCAVPGATAPAPPEAAAPARLTTETARALVGRVAENVARLRGLAFERPVPVEVIGDDEARRYVLRRTEEFQSEGDLQAMQRAYAVLGLLPPGYDVLDAILAALDEQAGGYYDPESKSFYLLDDIPPGLAEVVTAHELTHALEDQHFDLDRRLHAAVSDDDRMFALSAVHEGSATLLMAAYAADRMAAGELDVSSLLEFSRSEAAQAEVFMALPPVLRRQLLGPYVLGASFVAGGDMLGAMAGEYPVDRANRVYEDGPVSSEQILHPDKYWKDELRDTPSPVSLGDAGDLLGRRWTLRSSGALGELTLGVLIGAPTPDDPQSLGIYDGKSWTNLAASGWDGDRWELWTTHDKAVVLLATVWDRPEDAEEFAAALPDRPDLAWSRAGDRVAVVAGDAGKKTRRLLERILGASPEPPDRERD